MSNPIKWSHFTIQWTASTEQAGSYKIEAIREKTHFASAVRPGRLRMILRPANKTDIPAMHRVRLSVRENMLSDPNRITEADYVAALDELGRTWVVEIDGRIAAFATGYKSGSICALFVEPEYEGLGYGKALHGTVVRWLGSLGHERIWLTTGPNTRAEQFYISQGWRRTDNVGGDIRFELKPSFQTDRLD